VGYLSQEEFVKNRTFGLLPILLAVCLMTAAERLVAWLSIQGQA